MKHHNDNLLCVLDVETSGLVAGYHEILQIAAVPLGDDYRWNRHLPFFNHIMRPDFVERVDPDAIKTLRRTDTSLDYAKVVISKADIARFCNEGIDQSKCADMFIAWFEKLRLKPKKRLIPIGHNIQFDMEMIKHWLGQDTYDYIFDPRWRDTMSVSLFWNDVDAFRGDRCTFKDAKLGSLCTSLKVENMQAHNAFDDAIATAECYGRMVKQFNMTAHIPKDDEVQPPSGSLEEKAMIRAEDRLVKDLPQSLKDKIIQDWISKSSVSELQCLIKEKVNPPI